MSFATNAMNLSLEKKYFILLQVLCYIPLSMIRKIHRLSFTALIADAFILFGLLYLYYYDLLVLTTSGVGDIKLFNPQDFALFIGTAVFTFEGIGLIIPITESMKDPEKFPKVLTGVMIFVTILFTSIGVLSYAAFGSEIKTVVILNLPSDDRVVQSVQLLYALAILLSIPLQLFPAIRIMEQGLFTKSGKADPWVKWQKNLFRVIVVLFCALIAWGGASDLDKFVSLIGSFACVPLCFLYPPLFHFKASAETFYAKLIDVLMILFGIIALVYTSYITMKLWSEE
ncbi:7870_t:CDS:2 [Ambispora gerdemannii]|uniref:7870_t:CDS:1 n=1 Tax=Ambispora gerdemannii TaxID=144530 RepID=A0A9N9AVB8_9GLOM|nr:7870_t:CDS:2 [Ambispora gerdemannii]